MDNATDDFIPSGNWKLHGGMCQQLWSPVQKLLSVFPLVEAARPGSAPGIHALSLVHVGINKSKELLQHCSECSKLYLAVTANSLLTKFEKERSGLVDNVSILEELVVSELRSQLLQIRVELKAAVFSVDESEKQIGEELSKLIQKDPSIATTSAGTADEIDLELFYEAATKLRINSYKTALIERRSLKKLLVQASQEEDKLKEKVVAYLLKLMQNYSKLYRTEGDPDSSCSTPRSNDGDRMKSGSEIESLAVNSQALNASEEHSGRIPAPPEELKCPISVQLMYDPVVISSGQTFERVCIEKWFQAGYTTCPKTREHLKHRNLTPNSCVKNLIANWCKQNGVPVSSNPPDSPDITPFEHAISELGAVVSFSGKEIVSIEEEEEVGHKYERWMETLTGSYGWEKRKLAVLEIRYHLKDDVKARTDMGDGGFVDPLVMFLSEAIEKKDEESQEIGALALFNLAVNNNRNKEIVMSSGIIPLMDKMLDGTTMPTVEAAIALYLNITCLRASRPLLIQTRLTAFLVGSNRSNIPLSHTCRMDVFHALFNLLNHTSNVPALLELGIIPGMHPLVKAKTGWADKAMSMLALIAQEPSGNNAIRKTPGLISSVAEMLYSKELTEMEQSVSCLLALCNGDKKCIPMLVKEGVIPQLVMIKTNGSARAKDRAEKLLQVFRDVKRENGQERAQQQPDQLKVEEPEIQEVGTTSPQERVISNNATAAASRSPGVASNRSGTSNRSGSGNSRDSGNNDDAEDVGLVSKESKELSGSRSRRFGRAVTSFLKPKQHTRKTK
ncbi:U-box domain-containing family protein [Rhynchospora pubera]|uniref:RING-type E3 ubiquitin transferase n=1 Tax=Rhynchospora pubera TaxID=906938 RepID=A0AAV8CKV8_9POAL|nr:U-box domain-containing family protein [Rhynchospora pubera]